ncbi:phage infection protein [Sporosarcina sp. P21c]|uniref:YhgE/Pip domain-containing protein n=1 Tax=unclassified Sporosarcina TaxID=2647733 RepID=UPI000C1640DA|nr:MULTISPECIES: YhgE/Pip domain-containing protein [unclassified Sporosarcina]PIC67196.1 phage infection protein [Sporosarcina sp. P16a]PIC89510.1 phage infection protein [Sporosarcina sp. P21c]PIC92648.1 phage infection protein [Sporosarcina sp. P25]
MVKTSWNIFKLDLKHISKNWVVALLIGGLTFLPSLYAWLNIYATWDPYAHTDQLPVAIVNEDEGAMVRDKQIDVGKELIKTLQDNKEMDWTFTTSQEAMDGVEYGDYFAAIFIPKDFSSKLATVTSGEPEKAEINYFVNEKLNSIAPKITEKGASVIVDKVSNRFISTVNGVVLDMFNELGIEIENDLPDIKKFEQYIFDVQKQLPTIQRTLEGIVTDANSAKQIINKAQQLLPEAKRTTNAGLQTINDTIDQLTTAQNRLEAAAPRIKADLEKIAAITNETNEFLKKIQQISPDFTEWDRVKQEVDDRVTSSMEKLGGLEQDLLNIKKITEGLNGEQTDATLSQPIDAALIKVTNLHQLLSEIQQNAHTMNALVQGEEERLHNSINDLQKIAENTSIQANSFLKEYTDTIEPFVRKEITQALKTLSSAKALLIEVQHTFPEVQQTLLSADKHLSQGKQQVENALNQYPYVYDKVNQLANRIKDIQGSTDINEIIDLLQNNPQAERSFFEEPILLNETKLFPIKNYGTGMTPFYTVLSIWVGCLLLISLLATDISREGVFTSRQIYVGRLFTFGLIGCIQTLIVTTGDIVLLGVTVKEPIAFFLFGILISVVFMSIVYTLVSVFGDVGKAMAIVLLVLQIAGSGGTYPIMLLPSFFQWINPFLPFTYAIDLMREAVGGIVWARAIKGVLFLAIVGIVFITFGFVFKERMNKATNHLLAKSRETDLFH